MAVDTWVSLLLFIPYPPLGPPTKQHFWITVEPGVTLVSAATSLMHPLPLPDT